MRKPFFLFFLLLWEISPLSAQEPNPQSVPRPRDNPQSIRAVVIGISDYQDPYIPDLRFAHRDAEAFANFLRSPAGGSLDGEHLKVLTNDQATAGRIAEALDALVEQAKEGDQVIIYFSGHGDVERNIFSQPGFLLCWDAPSRVYMGGGTYSLAYLEAVVTTLSVQNKARVTVITDACHAGKLSGSQIGGAQLTSANLAKQYANEIKILSCQPNEFSLEGEQWGGGRGCFSYHLVDGLFGLADRNEDDLVTVGELDRYLEDKVTAEAAPQSQVPMLLGNKTERLARVNAQLLADLQKFKSGQMPVFMPVEERGFEDEVLSRVLGIDSGIREQYVAFKRAVQEKRFFEPENDCADVYYSRLSQNTALEPLWGFMKRNYAAALQDDAQQSINAFLSADVAQISRSRANALAEYRHYPRQLARAAELLGEKHYFYRPLLARKYYFEARLLQLSVGTNKNTENGKEILGLLEKSLEIEPQSPHVFLQMAQTFGYQLREPDSAQVYFSKAAGLAPAWYIPHTFYAEMLLNVFGMPEQALKVMDAALAIDANAIEVQSTMGMALRQLNRWQEAEQYYLNIIESKGATLNYPFVYNNLAVLYVTIGRFKDAEKMYKKAIEEDSTRALAYSNLGGFYMDNMPDYPEAERLLRIAIRLSPAFKQAIFNLGILLNRMGRYSEAAEQLETALKLDSTDFGIYTELSKSYCYLGRFAEAEASCKTILHMDSTYVDAYINLGQAYLQMGKIPDAKVQFNQAIRFDPTNVSALRNIGLIYQWSNQPEEAEKLFKRIIGLDSTHVIAHNDLGNIYVATNRLAESETHYLTAIRLDSTFKFAYNNLGILYQDYMGRHAEAEQLFKKAISLDFGYVDAWFNLGTVFQSTGRFAEAEAQYLQVIRLEPPAPDAWYYLAALKSKQNQPDTAFELMEQALKNGWKDYDWMQEDSEIALMREQTARWKSLMKKYFPDQVKD